MNRSKQNKEQTNQLPINNYKCNQDSPKPQIKRHRALTPLTPRCPRKPRPSAGGACAYWAGPSGSITPRGRGVSGRAELEHPRGFLGDETHSTPELDKGVNKVSGRRWQVIPSGQLGRHPPSDPARACPARRPGMSPRLPVLPAPTSAERRGLDTGSGRDWREENSGRGGTGRRRSTCSYSCRFAPRPPRPFSCAPRRRGQSWVGGWRRESTSLRDPHPRTSTPGSPNAPPCSPPLPLVLRLEGTLLLGVRGGIRSGEGSGIELKTVTKLKRRKKKEKLGPNSVLIRAFPNDSQVKAESRHRVDQRAPPVLTPSQPRGGQGITCPLRPDTQGLGDEPCPQTGVF